VIRPTYTEEDGWTFPAWWPKLARNVVETWYSASQAGDADLTWRQWGDHTARHVQLVTYLTPSDYGLGVSLNWQRRYERGGGNSVGGSIGFDVTIGPVVIVLSVHGGDVEAPRRVVPAVWDRAEPR
jgi:hypothetical protein